MEQVGAGIKKYAPNDFRDLHHQPARRDGLGAAEVLRPAEELVVGMAGVLDSGRFRLFLSQEFNVSVQDVTAFVLGGHGDTMVPLPRYSTVGGIPLTDLVKMGWITEKRLEEIVQRTRDGAPRSSACSRPARPIMRRRLRHRNGRSLPQGQEARLPCAAYLSGQYGVKDMYVGVPTIIGAVVSSASSRST